MANSNSPEGLKPVRYASGAPYNGAAHKMYVPASDATALFVGDPVIDVEGGDADGVPSCTRATAGTSNRISGVVVGVINTPSLTKPYRAASTAQYVLVARDPQLLFEIQEDSSGATLAASNIGQNINLVAGSGNTTTGRSGFQIASSTAATTSTLQMRIEAAVVRQDNAIGTNAKWLVRANQHTDALNSAGV